LGSRFSASLSVSLALLSWAAFAAEAKPDRASAVFAGGCFWCEETAFEGVAGVFSVTSGYTGGQTKNPSYEQVSAGVTGHAESVQVIYDPAKISYERLLEIFWHNVDPFARNAQFCDHGTQYRSAIFYQGDEQRERLQALGVKHDYVEQRNEAGQATHAVFTMSGPFPCQAVLRADYDEPGFDLELMNVRHHGPAKLRLAAEELNDEVLDEFGTWVLGADDAFERFFKRRWR